MAQELDFCDCVNIEQIKDIFQLFNLPCLVYESYPINSLMECYLDFSKFLLLCFQYSLYQIQRNSKAIHTIDFSKLSSENMYSESRIKSNTSIFSANYDTKYPNLLPFGTQICSECISNISDYYSGIDLLDHSPKIYTQFIPIYTRLGSMVSMIFTTAIVVRIPAVAVKFHNVYDYTIEWNPWQVSENHKPRVHPSHVREIG